MRVRRVFAIVFATMLSVSLAGGSTAPGEIPFKLVEGFGIVVQGGIGPLTNLNFLVDTGAVPSVLGERVASRIGARGASGTLALLNKDMQAQYVTVGDVHFGPIHAGGVTMVVVDLAQFERLLGTRIDAVIGLDILGGQNFGIDYKRRRITPGLSGSTRYVAPVEILTSSGAPYWVLPIHLGGRMLRVLLDTGANDFGLFAGRSASPGLGSPAKATTLRPVNLHMGDMPPKKQLAVVLREPPRVLGQIDGLLGPTALGITRIEFDWEHNCLRWDAE
jgi:hypothetical protein